MSGITQNESSPAAFFLGTTVAYAVLLGIASAANSGLLKLLSNAAAIVLFLSTLFVWAYLPTRHYKSRGLRISLFVYYLGLVAAVALNYKHIEISDSLKLFMAPIFVLFGMTCEAHRNEWLWNDLKIRQLFWVLVVLPFIVWGVQLATGSTSIGSGKEVAIFANRNNAGLYAVTLLALFNVLSGRPIKNIFIFLATGISFGTLGVLVAVLIALLVTVAKGKEVGMLLLVSSIVAGIHFAFPSVGVLSRFIPVVDTIKYLYEGRIDLRTSTYADLFRLLHTSDVSFAFRLKHWVNLYDIFMKLPFPEWFCGYGIGSAVRLSQSGLVPHNDYIRYLFECGLLAFIGFFSIISIVIYHCGRRWEAVPLLAVAIYFFSENLINNYLAMTIFYFCAGALVLRIGSEKPD